jgi:hypothetical protein
MVFTPKNSILKLLMNKDRQGIVELTKTIKLIIINQFVYLFNVVLLTLKEKVI